MKDEAGSIKWLRDGTGQAEMGDVDTLRLTDWIRKVHLCYSALAWHLPLSVRCLQNIAKTLLLLITFA